MSDGMRRELVYLSSYATNRYFIPNWGIISFPNDGELRVESIIREFEDYAMIDCKQYDKVVLQFITASH